MNEIAINIFDRLELSWTNGNLEKWVVSVKYVAKN